MKTRLAIIIIVVIVFLAACRSARTPAEPTPPPAVDNRADPTATPIPLPTKKTTVSSETSASSEEASSKSNTPTADGAAASSNQTSTSPIASPASTTSNADLPASTIFDLPWDDRSLFEAGLISSEQDVLEALPGASVYQLELTIADDLGLVSGREEVLYTNQEDTPLAEVYFHLYPNLLGGFSAISRVTVNGSPVEPTYELNNSIMRVPLPEALQPGEQAVIGLQFTASVPRTQERNYGIFASVDDILALAHFYPLIAVYDERGWDIEIPAAHGDVVYADISFYLARVTAPAEVTLVSSGVVVEESQADGQKTLTIAAGPMRDFYLAASDRYQVVSQKVGQTTVNSYFPSEQPEGGELVLQYAVDAVESFNERYGLYPFSELDLAPTANLALGIEYPGMTAINILLYDPHGKIGKAPTSAYLEATVAHEVGHQWFYSLVGNDQLAEPWVDEALTQYATWRYFLDTHGEAGAQGFEESLRGRWKGAENTDIPIGRPVSAYTDREYSAIVYGRGPLFFAALAEVMGQETLDEFLRDYAQTYRWGIARADDLKRLAEAHCQCDLTDLFAEWVYE